MKGSKIEMYLNKKSKVATQAKPTGLKDDEVEIITLDLSLDISKHAARPARQIKKSK